MERPTEVEGEQVRLGPEQQDFMRRQGVRPDHLGERPLLLRRLLGRLDHECHHQPANPDRGGRQAEAPLRGADRAGWCAHQPRLRGAPEGDRRARETPAAGNRRA